MGRWFQIRTNHTVSDRINYALKNWRGADSVELDMLASDYFKTKFIDKVKLNGNFYMQKRILAISGIIGCVGVMG